MIFLPVLSVEEKRANGLATRVAFLSRTSSWLGVSPALHWVLMMIQSF